MNTNHEDLNLSSDEQELIAFHLDESCDERAIRKRLQTDEAYADLSESVNRTLRVFSAEPVPSPDTNAAWLRLRPSLPVLKKPTKAPSWRGILIPVAVVVAVIVFAILLRPHLRHRNAEPDEAGIIRLQPPVNSARDQDVSNHLDRAERWLTTVNHASALDEETRAEGQQLLTSNAVYLHQARSQGDLPDAVALERLERVLTAANHTSEGGVQLRVEMNTDGLLFDLRILRQNHSYSNGEPQ